MERKTLTFPGAVLKADEATGEVIAVVNTTNVQDRQKDTMIPGCFSKVIAEKQEPAICWAHDTDRIIGRWEQIEELPPGDPRVPYNQSNAKAAGTAGGLLLTGKFAMGTQDGREAHYLVKERFVRDWSVQFGITPDGEESDGKGGRNVKMVDLLLEASPVIIGASPGTATIAAKALTEAIERSADRQSFMQTLHDLTAESGCCTAVKAEHAASPAEPTPDIPPASTTEPIPPHVPELDVLRGYARVRQIVAHRNNSM